MCTLNSVFWISLCACCSLFLFVEVTDTQKLPGLLKLPMDKTFHLNGRLSQLRFLSYFILISHVPPWKHDYVHLGYVGQLFSLETTTG